MRICRNPLFVNPVPKFSRHEELVQIWKVLQGEGKVGHERIAKGCGAFKMSVATSVYPSPACLLMAIALRKGEADCHIEEYPSASKT